MYKTSKGRRVLDGGAVGLHLPTYPPRPHGSLEGPQKHPPRETSENCLLCYMRIAQELHVVLPPASWRSDLHSHELETIYLPPNLL